MRQYRNLLVGMRANFLLAEHASLDRATACRNIFDRYYEWTSGLS